jgi:hypothetical protein
VKSSINYFDEINLDTNQKREKKKCLLMMMKAMFRKLFKGSSKDRVAAAAGPAVVNIGNNDQEGNNKIGSPSRRIKW